MFESMKNLTAKQPLGKTGENARRIAATIVLQKADVALEKVFGQEAAKNLKPVTFRDGELTIEVGHGVWAQDLALQRPEAIEAINSELGQSLVRKITIR